MRRLGVADPFRSLFQFAPELPGFVDLSGKGDRIRLELFTFLGNSVALFGGLILRFELRTLGAKCFQQMGLKKCPTRSLWSLVPALSNAVPGALPVLESDRSYREEPPAPFVVLGSGKMFLQQRPGLDRRT